ncbi:hypothetical protein J3R82DRAFT_2699 [Butyriboletus roseoflavus]|nr:hypothetical protein J3R82DRAFT_2699 [Butyriboletus roseoflavus]
MSTHANATNPGSVPPSAAPPAPDPNAIIQPSLNSIMIGHTFLTLLLPLLIALFYFSTPHSRRRPIFILNVVAIILAFTAGVMIDAFAIHSILSLQDPWPPSIARVVNMIIFIKVLVDAARGPLGPENIAIVWAATPYLKIEWSAQVVDNAYASLAFLWTIRDRGNEQGVTSNIHPNKVTFAQRMRTLSRIALSNFIIPSLFSIAQLVVVYRDVNILIVNEIVLVNTMLAVFGVVFATVWSGNVSRREAETDLRVNASPIDNNAMEKRHPHGFSFPGLGTWRVATSPPTLTFGSTGSTIPTDGANFSARGAFESEKGNSRGVLVEVGDTVAASGALEVEVDEEDVVKSSGLSTPCYQ